MMMDYMVKILLIYIIYKYVNQDQNFEHCSQWENEIKAN